jgi:hypothetical protein
MERGLTLELTEFGRGLLEEQARREQVPLDTVVREAAVYYAADLDSSRPAATPPPQPAARWADGSSALELRLDLDASTWDALSGAAERHGVPVERMLVHAALYYVADMSSGRLARRLADKLGEEGEEGRDGEEQEG